MAAGEGHLVCLEVGDAALREAGHVALGAEVACLSAAPLEEGAAAAALVAVGTWDRNVHMLSLPGLAAACPPEALGGDVIPRRHVPLLAANLQPLTLKANQRPTCKYLWKYGVTLERVRCNASTQEYSHEGEGALQNNVTAFDEVIEGCWVASAI